MCQMLPIEEVRVGLQLAAKFLPIVKVVVQGWQRGHGEASCRKKMHKKVKRNLESFQHA